jgi:broad specificity phosphatase PhoE
MTAIWLIRHASTAWTGSRWCGRSDPPLTPTGLAEAVALGATLRPRLEAGTVVLSSPAQRAVATARALAVGGPVIVDPDLHEVDFGEVDGLTFDELETRHTALAHRILAGDPMIDWPGGDTASDLQRRAIRAWTKLTRTSRQSTVVAVTHGGLIRVILAEAIGERAPEAGHLDPATAIRIVRQDGTWSYDPIPVAADLILAEPA